MGKEKADVVFTSPPYAQQRDYGAKIANWPTLMISAFSNVPARSTTQILVNLGLIHSDGEWLPYWEPWVAWMRKTGWRSFGWYVWDQGHGLRGDWAGRCAPSHEFIFHFNRVAVKPQKWIASKHAGEKGGALRNADGSFHPVTTEVIQPFKLPDSVWRVERQKGGVDGHPAPFSVALAEHALRSWPGVSYEPFAGSGTVIIAAERLRQTSFAIEIEPSYCQVIIDRWEAFTGQKAKKVGEVPGSKRRRKAVA